MERIDLDNKTLLVTGAAGFIGANLVKKLLSYVPTANIIGIDSVNDYYDVKLKEYRLKELSRYTGFDFIKGNIADKNLMNSLFEKYRPSVVVNLAAQAGVRYSIENPDAYIESNIIGFFNVLESCRRFPVEHLVYASSSSVYGSNKKVPYSTEDKVDNPVSLYAATKKSNELMAYSYAKLYNIPSTGLRFFTVYGPAGRPDMAYFGFTDKLVRGDTIKIFNYGNCKRDFTYIDDIVEGVVRVMQGAPEKKNGEDGLPIPPYAVYNIGNNHPENLLDFVRILSEELVRAGVLPENSDFEAHRSLYLCSREMCPSLMPIRMPWKEITVLNRVLRSEQESENLPSGIKYAICKGVWNMNQKYTIAVAGTGYVGLSVATLLSQHHKVYAVDIVPEKVELINQKKSPIQDDYIEKYLAEKKLDLTATLDAESAYSKADFVVIAAPTV